MQIGIAEAEKGLQQAELQLVIGREAQNQHPKARQWMHFLFYQSYITLMKIRGARSSLFRFCYSLSAWNPVSLKDPDEWTLGTNNKPSFLPLSLLCPSSFLSPPSLLCLGRWGNPGLFLAWLAYPAIRGLGRWREHREAEVKETWCTLCCSLSEAKTQIWGQKEENGAGQKESEWIGWATSTAKLLRLSGWCSEIVQGLIFNGALK